MKFNHYWFVVYEDEYKWYYFIVHQDFIVLYFLKKFDALLIFSEHKNKEYDWNISWIKPNYWIYANKVLRTSCKLRDSLFLLNEDKYGLALESILDLYKLNYMPKIVLDKLQKEWCAIISEKNIIRDIDKYLIWHTIKSSLRVNEVEIQTFQILLYKIWEEYSNINLIRPS